MDLSEILDTYGRRARLQPALLTLFPLFVAVAVWLPALYKFGAALLSLAIACGITALLAHYARVSGRRAQAVLYKQWGGAPTTLWLRSTDSHIDAPTKQRYYSFLESHVPNWQRPAHEGPDADSSYGTAVKWLLEYTRDKARFPLVFKENISYGFRRNLYGLKLPGLLCCALAAALNLLGLWTHDFLRAGQADAIGIASMVINVFAIATWILVVSPDWVRDAGDAYARALLAACEGL